MQDLNSLTRDQTCATYIGSTESFLKKFLLQGVCFTILCWFLPYINMRQPQVYIHPLPLGPPCQLPPHPALLRCHGALGWAPCVTQPIHWLSSLHVVMYVSMLLSIRLILSLTLCPRVCSLYLHLHWCPANRFISTIFIDSIYMLNIQYLSLTYFSLYNRL